MASTTGILSLTTAVEHAATLPIDSREREVADFRVAELAYLLRVHAVMPLLLPCMKIDAMVNGVANPDRPYLTWSCCDTHRGLMATKTGLKQLAAALGVEMLDVMTPVEP